MRMTGRTYGFAIGAEVQLWAIRNKKQDPIKGLCRCVGVRDDAWATNARPLLLAIEGGIEQFFDSRGKSENRLISAVREQLQSPGVRAQLWLIATISEGLLQPLRFAINKNEGSKSMYSMIETFTLFESRISAWSDGKQIDELFSASLWNQISAEQRSSVKAIHGATDAKWVAQKVLQSACACAQQ